MRYAAGANQHRSVAALIEVRRELRDAQVIGSEGDDDVGRNRLMPQLMVLPDDACRAQGFFGHVFPLCGLHSLEGKNVAYDRHDRPSG